MVAPAAFPVAKLGFLLVKQVSKPLAKSVAARAKKSPIFKDWICVPIAQLFHFYEVKMKMRALNLGTGKVTKVPKLTEAKAVEQGAEILSEMIIISIASGILIYEYNRSKEKDDAKEEKLRADRESIKNKIFELELKVEKQSTQIRNLAKTAIHLEEEMQKKSLKKLLGKPVDIPQELIKTVEEIPEEPNVVKPLELYEDRIKEVSENLSQPVEEAVQSPTIKEIVDKHYSALKEETDRQRMSTENVGTSLPQEDSGKGIISDSVQYVLSKENFGGSVSHSQEGVVKGALSYFFDKGKN